MRTKLITKLIFSYIIIFSLTFIIINTFGVQKLKQKHISECVSTLYQESQNIANEYLNNTTENKPSDTLMLEQLKLLDSALNTRILVLNSSGTIIMDTKQNFIVGNTVAVKEEFLSKVYSENELLDGFFQEPMLCVNYPIYSGVELKGYLTLSYSMQRIEKATRNDREIINYTVLIIAGLIIISFLIILLFVLRPVALIQKGIKEFTDGNFNYTIKVQSHDEFYTLADSINYMGQQLASLDEYQKNFIANISHDFRSPLTSIKGYAEAMKDGTIPVDKQSRYLDIILFEAERLTKLTSNLLTLNNMQYNGSFLNITVFDINRVVKMTAEAFEGICTKKKITIELNFIEQRTLVCGDVDKIQQVLYNLLDNAVKFSNNNSTIQMNVTEKLDKIYVAIKDHGVGIPSDCIYKIWDRFYKTDPSRGKDKRGTGLGLAIVKEIINAHGENITVVSTVNVGTEFVFTLSIPEEE